MQVRVVHPTNRPNFSEVTINYVTIGFSYETPVAFYTAARGWTVRQNEWGPTTGKHLGHYPVDKNDRIDGENFLKALDNALATG